VFGLGNAFPLPSECLRVISAHGSDSIYDNIKYNLEVLSISGIHTQVLVTDSSQVYLKFIKRVDPSIWSSSFAEAFVDDLAFNLAIARNKSRTILDVLGNAAKKSLAYAKSIDGIQNYPSEFPQGSWVESR
jgi:hypothetical protein